MARTLGLRRVGSAKKGVGAARVVQHSPGRVIDAGGLNQSLAALPAFLPGDLLVVRTSAAVTAIEKHFRRSAPRRPPPAAGAVAAWAAVAREGQQPDGMAAIFLDGA